MSHPLNSKRLSMREASQHVNVHVATIWRWALHGVRGRRLRTFLLGGRRYVVLSELDAFAEPYDPVDEAGIPNRGGDFLRSSIAAADLTQRGV